jgi:hypothetical protein
MKRPLLIAIIFLVAVNLAVWGPAVSAAGDAYDGAKFKSSFQNLPEEECPPRAAQREGREDSLIETIKEWWRRLTQDERDEDEDDDADLPAVAKGKISKAEYLELRAKYIQRLRGISEDQPFDPSWRGAAIRQMEEQEQRLRKGRMDEMSADGSDSLAGGTWTFIGPAPIPNGQTTSVSTAVSGRITAIDVDPTNPNIAYVGAAQGGVFRTMDGGATWTPLLDTAQTLAVGAIAVAPSDPSKVYIGTGEGNSALDSFFGVGIYRIDNANTAQPSLVGPFNKDGANQDVFTGTGVTRILVHPTNPDIIFVSTTFAFGGLSGNLTSPLPARGVYRSTNATQANPTFTRLVVTSANNTDRRVTDMVFEPGNPNNMLVAVGGFAGSDNAPDGGIYVTTNALATTPTFTRILTIGTTSVIRSNIAVNKVGNTVTVLVADGYNAGRTASGTGTLMKATGNDFGSLGAFTQLTAANGYCGGQCFYDIFVAMDPNNANIIYLGGSANSGSAAASGRSSIFQRSTDGGQTFTRIDRGLHADSHAFIVTPSNPARGYFGSDGGVWRSDNVNASDPTSVSWTSLNNSSISATQFQSIAVHPVDPKFTIGGTQDNGTEYRDPSGNWVRADGGDGGYTVIDQNATDTSNVTMYHTYFNQTGNLLGFARADSVSGGFQNFYGCGGTNNGINCSDTATLFYAPLVRGPGSPNTIYYGTDRLYRSADKGVTATVVSQAPIVSGVAISAIGISPQNDQLRVVGLANGQVFATANGSTTLTNVSAGLPSNPGRYVSRAVFDPNNPSVVYITFADFNVPNGTVWRTTNLTAASLAANSVTWTSVSGTSANALPNVPVNALVVDPQNSNQLYAGTDIGVYFSADGGANWSPFGTGLPRVAVFDMAATSNRLLRIATHGRGMWETPMATPDIAPNVIGGRITDANGNPLPGILVTAAGPITVITVTDANGNYSFKNLLTNGTYMITPSSQVYTFNPANRGITLNQNQTNANVVGTLVNVNANQIDEVAFFVRQQYIDFLNREPDSAGFNFWFSQITSCGSDSNCIDVKRQNVSAAYFLSREFQETGFFVIKVQRVAFGKMSNDASKRISYSQFLNDAQTVGQGFVDGQTGADAVLDQNKTNYAQAVVSSGDFTAKYSNSLSASAFVDALYQTANVTPQGTERQDAINAFGGGGTAGRAAALRKVAESNSVKQAEFSPAFVLLQYFGYLRRNPTDLPDTSDAGYQFWLNKLNAFGGDYIRSEMVRSFILSSEYRKRFGRS